MTNQIPLPIQLHYQKRPLTPRQADIIKGMREAAEAKPYEVYGDYRDELGEDQIQALLDGDTDKFFELWDHVETNAWDYADRDGWEAEIRKEVIADLEITDEELEELNELIDETLSENFRVDTSDLLRTCLRNSRCKVTAMLLDEDGEPYYFPHWENGDEQNAELVTKLDFVKDPYAAECVYASEVLKICGSIDLEQVYDNLLLGYKMPVKIKVGFRDSNNALLHQSWSGSGNMGSIEFTKEAVYTCQLSNDSANRYGVDAVYGFTGQFWGHELELVWEKEDA